MSWKIGFKYGKKAKKSAKTAWRGTLKFAKRAKKSAKRLFKKAKTASKMLIKAKKKKVVVKDRGFSERQKELRKFNRATFAIGVFAEEGSKEYADGTTVADVAAWNEYGVPGKIPARPFVGGYLEEKRPAIQELLKRLAAGVAAGTYSAEEAAERAGSTLAGGMKKRIAEGSAFTPNAPSTVARKGSSKPLIDTGQLRSAITYEVTFAGVRLRGNDAGRR